LTHDHFAENESSFDRFAETSVVCDEEVDSRHLERFLQWLQLIRHDLNAGTIRRLEKSGVRGGDQIPAERVKVRREDMRRVETLVREMPPVRLVQDLGVDLAFPKDRKVLPLGVILQAGKINECLFPVGLASGLDSFDQMPAAADLDHAAGFGNDFGVRYRHVF
jgi:hypothetical protein